MENMMHRLDLTPGTPKDVLQNSTPKLTTKATFLSLPAELRNKVYELYFDGIDDRIRSSWIRSDDGSFCFSMRDFEIFLASRQVNAESASWFWHKHQHYFRGAKFVWSTSIRSIAAAWNRHSRAFAEEPEIMYNLDADSWYGYHGPRHTAKVNDLMDLLERSRASYDEAGERLVAFTGRHDVVESMRLPVQESEVDCEGDDGSVGRGFGPWCRQLRVQCNLEPYKVRFLEFYASDGAKAYKFRLRFCLKNQAVWLSGPLSRLDWALMAEDAVQGRRRRRFIGGL
ncbi:uncharacterized protein CLAFUR5_09918 [Fulvia fulva]|uniref:Uncharacterized protein n=1 Tax=Passalora fulva TaxID=5499 RepID=A0A9Q8PBR6_PASFU|nr:uncharacterized protein CLAFUR5_09918 [Fulvia fulva]UJO19563.1 hypothetical protein CLAFUR5_09918 [Fulvia fulva]